MQCSCITKMLSPNTGATAAERATSSLWPCSVSAMPLLSSGRRTFPKDNTSFSRHYLLTRSKLPLLLMHCLREMTQQHLCLTSLPEITVSGEWWSHRGKAEGALVSERSNVPRTAAHEGPGVLYVKCHKVTQNHCQDGNTRHLTVWFKQEKW